MDEIFDSLNNSNIILALDGDSFEYIHSHLIDDNELLNKVMSKIYVFGRTNPKQKEKIVQKYMDIYKENDYCVGFVGDGSNDCQALNKANLGLSIGNNEASLASSFSTSKEDISPVIDII